MKNVHNYCKSLRNSDRRAGEIGQVVCFPMHDSLVVGVHGLDDTTIVNNSFLYKIKQVRPLSLNGRIISII